MRWDRDSRVRLRLLRAAAHYLPEGRILRLDDPFGTKLLWEESDGKLRIWSVGQDGRDNGGKAYSTGSGTDIILEVIR